jgi:hypothetical protein
MFTGLLTFLLATAAAAAPLAPSVVDLHNPGTNALNSTPWDGKRPLFPHEVLLYGHDGNSSRAEIIHRDVYHSMFKRGGLFGPSDALAAAEGILSHRPEVNTTFLNQMPTSTLTTAQAAALKEAAEKAGNEKRCTSVTSAVTDSQSTFVDWDVQMSPVVAATAPTTSVTVSSGYSVSNSVTVGSGLDYTWVKDVLKTTLKIDYSHSWTTSYSASVTYVMSQGYHGTIVTNPTTHRRYGRILQGCVGAQAVKGTFMADNHDQGSYGGISWVAGAISLCQKKESPLTRCEGSGAFK